MNGVWRSDHQRPAWHALGEGLKQACGRAPHVRRCTGVGLAAAMLVATAAATAPVLGAQQSSLLSSGSRPSSVLMGRGASESTHARLLDQTISVSIRDMVLIDALRAVAQAASATLTYTNAVANLPVRRSLVGRDITLEHALEKLLTGTSLQAKVMPPNDIVIVDRNAVAPDSATVTGRVIDAATQQPIANATVSIRGTNRRTLTNEHGVFALRNVAPGRLMVQAQRLGYTPLAKTITLVAQEDTSIVFAMVTAASPLTEVVTTGSGERSKLEVGNTIATINADSIMKTTPVTNVSDLLANRIPGLQTLSGTGAVGSPTRIRIRGLSSIESDNSPIVIIDGIRMSTAATTAQQNSLYAGVVGGAGSTTSGFAGGNSQNDLSSRLDDIDPNTIESIEVMKGPAASTLYGSDAANGVIIIKTKRGHPGSTRWSFYGDHRALVQPSNYDYPVKQLGTTLLGGAPLNIDCSLLALSRGGCVPLPGQYKGFNMLDNPDFTPQAIGHTQTIGGNVSGGNNDMQYFLGGTYLDELGTAKLPNVNANWIKDGRGGQPLAQETLRPNADDNASGDARITGNLPGNSDYALGATFISQYQRVGNDGMDGLLTGADTPRLPTDTTPIDGWTNWNASRQQHIKHILGSAQSNWRPSFGGGQLFSANGNYGWDFSLNDDRYWIPRGSCAPLCTSSSDQGVLGYIDGGRATDFTQTINLGGVLTIPVTSWLESQTRFGGNYVKRQTDNLYGYNSNLRPGIGFYAANGTGSIQEIGDIRSTAGWYLEQNANIGQSLFLTLGLRKDAGSALGETVNPVYPKWNGSWVVSNEPFFPWKDVISTLRLRFAYGRAGVMPTSTARIRTYAVQTNYVLDNGSPTGSYAQLTGPGNPWVRPELSQEFESGFDLELFQSRFTFGFTSYLKKTHDAIQRDPLAGSVGALQTYQALLNVGDVRNNGLEFESTLRVLDGDNISYTIDGNVTTTHNKLVRLAPGQVTFLSISASGDLYTGNDSRIAQGYPLFGRWAYPILGWSDANGNGIIDPQEVHVGDSLAYVGPTDAPYTAYVGHTLGFFHNRLSLRANFAYSSGMTQFNQARKDESLNLSIAQGLSNLADQACVVATQASGARRATDWCYMETVRVLRFQDLSLSYELPVSLVRKAHAQSATLTLMGNNLHLWTNYKGIDPGINTTPVSGNSVVNGDAFPTPRAYGFRVQIAY